MWWGVIGYNYKGPFQVREAETEQEGKEASSAFAVINEIAKEEAIRLEAEWKASNKADIIKHSKYCRGD